ncbi:hypothetical protein MMCCUG48898_2921 [Mycobacteroides abscessus subsp. massiliense CCUG 48898 = JCM 15300]|nr:hypothetical protein MMAS_27840 [Mycobacteroides abscessus subsp. massiliense CCUG 48898 = JCM 15300]EIV64012.1 hypothetical protein MMCCUG48898_2921 [Mycobacteroides abscessus subsp. massiliense CCUG 48898 = JCM 15300]BAP97691.1 hypothetical protein MMASJCM_2915 [Mycobacteroides abscessus subsp. massiliense CCUG 48898 = JCM 15300]
MEPGIEVRIRYLGGELIAETRTRGELYIVKATPPSRQYRRS